jgi:hypothetical protein
MPDFQTPKPGRRPESPSEQLLKQHFKSTDPKNEDDFPALTLQAV